MQKITPKGGTVDIFAISFTFKQLFCMSRLHVWFLVVFMLFLCLFRAFFVPSFFEFSAYVFIEKYEFFSEIHEIPSIAIQIQLLYIIQKII